MSGRAILHDAAGEHRDGTAEALLVERAGGDARESNHSPDVADRISCRRASRLARHDEQHAAEAERHADPLPAAEALAQQRPGRDRGNHGLQPHDERNGRQRHAPGDRAEHASQVGAMNEQSRSRGMQRLARRMQPRRAGNARQHEQERHHGQVAPGEKGERLREGLAQPAADESRAPQENEEDGRPAKPRGRMGVQWDARKMGSGDFTRAAVPINRERQDPGARHNPPTTPLPP